MKYASVPMCDKCWHKQQPGREPVKFKEPVQEICYFCKQVNSSGIYVRVREAK